MPGLQAQKPHRIKDGIRKRNAKGQGSAEMPGTVVAAASARRLLYAEAPPVRSGHKY